jgi:hypothetical protein
MTTLRQQALRVVQAPDPSSKVALTRLVAASGEPVGADLRIDEPPGLPGRPAQPALVPHAALVQRSLATVEGRAALVHAIARGEAASGPASLRALFESTRGVRGVTASGVTIGIWPLIGLLMRISPRRRSRGRGGRSDRCPVRPES